jgi:hypothetical protein
MPSMRALSSLVALATAAVFVPADAVGQTPTVPIDRVGSCGLVAVKTEKPTAALTNAYESGDWAKFRAVVVELRNAIPKAVEEGCASVKIAPSDSLHVIWIGKTSMGDTSLLSAVVTPAAADGYTSRLPGLSGESKARLYQLFVAENRTDALASMYTFTREQSPLLAQIPDVADRILGPMLSLLSTTLRSEATARPARTPGAVGWATVARVPVAFDRAAVKVVLKASVPVQDVRLTKASASLARTLTLVDVRYSKPARGLATELDKIVKAEAAACVAPGADCLAALDKKFSEKVANACPTTSCSEDDVEAVHLVDGKFRELVEGLTEKELNGSADLKNVPLTKYSFGLMTGLMFGRKSTAPRAEIDDGVLAADPLDRQLNMVVLNRAFTPYDADAFDPTPQERWRWFVGAAITPTFGVGAGVSYLPVRGLGVNVGVAVLGINAPNKGDDIGSAPTDEDDPFRLAATYTGFIGLSYNFK